MEYKLSLSMKLSECFDEGKDCECVRIFSEGGVMLKSYTVDVFSLPFMHYIAFYEANRWIDFVVVYILKA